LPVLLHDAAIALVPVRAFVYPFPWADDEVEARSVSFVELVVRALFEVTEYSAGQWNVDRMYIWLGASFCKRFEPSGGVWAPE